MKLKKLWYWSRCEGKKYDLLPDKSREVPLFDVLVDDEDEVAKLVSDQNNHAPVGQVDHKELGVGRLVDRDAQDQVDEHEEEKNNPATTHDRIQFYLVKNRPRDMLLYTSISREVKLQSYTRIRHTSWPRVYLFVTMFRPQLSMLRFMR